jgi:hypothetical protein
LLGAWFEKASARRAALRHRIPLEPGPLQDLLVKGRPVDDAGQVMNEMGFSAGIWNGNAISVGMIARCGITYQAKEFGNRVVLNLPPAEGGALAIYRPATARQIMVALADCWEPDWATLTSDTLRRAQQPTPRSSVVGWMTYLGAGRSIDAELLPSGVSAEALASGTLITIGNDITAVNGELALAVRDALGDTLSPST